MNLQTLIIVLVVCATSCVVTSQNCPNQKVVIICTSIYELKFKHVGELLKCTADDSVTSTDPKSTVSSVVHSNKSEVANLPLIEGLTFIGVNIKFIPFGIKSKFPNLRALRIYDCGLLIVSKDNLKQFGSSLESLDLYNNNLQSIEGDLLEYNPNLRAIRLNNNPLQYIGPEFFTHLKTMKNLKWLDLEAAKCMSQKYDTDDGHGDITTFKWKNTGICSSEYARERTMNAVKEYTCVEA